MTGVLAMVLTGLCMAGTVCVAVVPLPTGTVGSGAAATDSRSVADFTGIRFVGLGRIEVDSGELQPVELTFDDNLLALISTEVVDGVLVIEATEPFLPTMELVVRATVPDLQSVEVDGGGEVTVTGVDNAGMSIAVDGVGKATLSGQTDRLTIDIDGAGSVSARELEADAVEITIDGGGQAWVNAANTLDVAIDGFGVVRYNGDPAVTQDISGLAVIQKLD